LKELVAVAVLPQVQQPEVEVPLQLLLAMVLQALQILEAVEVLEVLLEVKALLEELEDPE
tara:strand:- start:159 stop:338 length:180 start_codon:yes stop_codon:yes gene_type:complete